jgi:hypothetical protein
MDQASANGIVVRFAAQLSGQKTHRETHRAIRRKPIKEQLLRPEFRFKAAPN